MKYQFLISILFLFIILGCSKDDSINNNNGVNVSINRQAVGSSANDLLSSTSFKSLIIELVYVEGFEPTATTVSNFVSFLQNRLNKPNGIIVEKRAIAPPGKEVYTIQDIVDIEMEQRQNYNTNNQIAVWALFADGKSSQDSNNHLVLGTAYWNTSFVIYQETIQDLSNSPFEPSRSLVETTVINHEFGHILGLTNLGSSMQDDHEDEAHPKHCHVESCLMYWSTESSAGMDNLIGLSSAPQLDEQCIADLRANGGK